MPRSQKSLTTHPRSADRLVPARRTAAGGEIAVGTYLTNEVFLYRVVDVAASPAGSIVALEDCFGLDVVHVALADVRARRLRIVTPAPS